jgi:hypothetical protein
MRTQLLARPLAAVRLARVVQSRDVGSPGLAASSKRTELVAIVATAFDLCTRAKEQGLNQRSSDSIVQLTG